MSITIPGVLTIKSIEGARGVFSVGDLRTEVGEFRIKDALLDEYEPGQYTGRFVISNIYPSSYTWRGRVSIEIRARLQEMMLDEVELGPLDNSVPAIEPDPLDEESGTTKTKTLDAPRSETTPEEPAVKHGSDSQPAEGSSSLFGHEIQAMIDAGELVKLDPTVDRTLFRQQRDALKAMGYAFNPATQSWSKPS